MKTSISILFFALVAIFSTQNLPAQRATIDALFEAIPESSEITKFELSGFFLNLATNVSDDDGSRILKGIKSVRFLQADHINEMPQQELKAFGRSLVRNNFEPLTEIRDGGDKIRILVKESGDSISDLVAIIQDNEGGYLMLAIEGEFRYEDLQKIDMDIEGLDKVKSNTKGRQRA